MIPVENDTLIGTSTIYTVFEGKQIMCVTFDKQIAFSSLSYSINMRRILCGNGHSHYNIFVSPFEKVLKDLPLEMLINLQS